MDLFRLQAMEQDRAAERDRLHLLARTRSDGPSSPGVFTRAAHAIRAAVQRRNPCPQPPCPDLESHARPAYDR